ncbi:MAG TPA: heat-inducible transcriptional repressor HrcA [Elusimicrobiota bacterium]|nr:heat-inducible transcriptional repressor HrcA [Elusimicrobiota bacterium]
MRVLATEEYEERKRKLLQAVIHHYIRTAKPVGSSVLADEYKLDISSATIRNVLAELEEEGYLTHPHTSAGRIPTDRGYRAYVDSLMEVQRLAIEEEVRIQQEYQSRIREIQDLMFTTTRALSALSQFTGFAISPTLDESRIKHVELIPLDGGRILAVFVAESGCVRHQILSFKGVPSSETLRSIARMLNQRLAGHTLNEVRSSVMDSIAAWEQEQLEMMGWAQKIVRQAFDICDEDKVYLEGTSHILELPDFQDFEQIRSLAHLLDEKKVLGEALSQGMQTEASRTKKWGDVMVRIGTENRIPGLQNVSLVTSTYHIKDRPVGVLGIIGPRRMEYSKMIAIVGSVSRLVSKVLSKLGGEG